MTIYADDKQQAGSPVLRSATPVSPAAGASPPTRYEDHFWADQWWLTIRDASRLRHITDSIHLEPVPDAAATRKELDDMLAKQASPDREHRRADIIAQHEALPSFFSPLLMTKPPGNARTEGLITTAVVWSRQPIMALKYRYKRPRPSQVEPRLMPMIEVPRHAAYPSGHSTQLHLIAHVVHAVTGRTDMRDAFMHFAGEVALNREYAGFHYESDSAAGAKLALALAPHFLTLFDDELRQAQREWM
jgi:hypothetical protein